MISFIHVVILYCTSAHSLLTADTCTTQCMWEALYSVVQWTRCCISRPRASHISTFLVQICWKQSLHMQFYFKRACGSHYVFTDRFTYIDTQLSLYFQEKNFNIHSKLSIYMYMYISTYILC